MSPLLFNIDLCISFLIMIHEDIASHTDMTVRLTFPEKNIDEVVRCIEKSSRVFFKWFSDNQFPANASKFHALLSSDQHVPVNIGASQV